MFGSKYTEGSIVPRSDVGKVLGTAKYADVELQAVQNRNGSVSLQGEYKGYPVKPTSGDIYNFATDKLERAKGTFLEVDVSKDYKRSAPRVIKVKGDPKLYVYDWSGSSNRYTGQNVNEWIKGFKEYKHK